MLCHGLDDDDHHRPRRRAHDDGDLADARVRWEESTAAGAAARHVGGTLAQQLLLALLHRDEGDEAGARAIAAL